MYSSILAMLYNSPSMSESGHKRSFRDTTGMSAPGGRADVIGVKADIASLAGRPGLRRRWNRLASEYIWPYSAISAFRLPRHPREQDRAPEAMSPACSKVSEYKPRRVAFCLSPQSVVVLSI